ncbi:MAG: CBS domain-containing protein [Thermoplasmata archaeon]|nr:CBS domain-containing protein [Thermoplasmata archaeon]
MAASKTVDESPRATMNLTETEELAFPTSRLYSGRRAVGRRPLAYNLCVRDVMTREVLTVSRSTPLLKAALMMQRRNVTGIPVVVGKDRLIGVVSETDVLRVLSPQAGTTPLGMLLTGIMLEPTVRQEGFLARCRTMLLKTQVGAAMTPDAVSIGPEATVEMASRTMVEERVRRLPVVENGRLIGILARDDIVRATLPGELP